MTNTTTAPAAAKTNRYTLGALQALAASLAKDAGTVIRTPAVTSRMSLADHHKVVGYLGDLSSALATRLRAFTDLTRPLGEAARDRSTSAERDAERAVAHLSQGTAALKRGLGLLAAHDPKAPQVEVHASNELLRALVDALNDTLSCGHLDQVSEPTVLLVEDLAGSLSGYAKNMGQILKVEEALLGSVLRGLPRLSGLPGLGRTARDALEGGHRNLGLVSRDLGEVLALARKARNG